MNFGIESVFSEGLGSNFSERSESVSGSALLSMAKFLVNVSFPTPPWICFEHGTTIRTGITCKKIPF